MADPLGPQTSGVPQPDHTIDWYRTKLDAAVSARIHEKSDALGLARHGATPRTRPNVVQSLVAVERLHDSERTLYECEWPKQALDGHSCSATAMRIPAV